MFVNYTRAWQYGRVYNIALRCMSNIAEKEVTTLVVTTKEQAMEVNAKLMSLQNIERSINKPIHAVDTEVLINEAITL